MTTGSQRAAKPKGVAFAATVLASLGLASALSACSGGGSSALDTDPVIEPPDPEPTPEPEPEPEPEPTPEPVSYPTFNQALDEEAGLSISVDLDGSSAVDLTLRGNNATLRLDNDAASLGADDLISVTEGIRLLASGNEVLRLSEFESDVWDRPLDHTAFGTWTKLGAFLDEGVQVREVVSLYGGVATVASDMPSSSASYAGSAVAVEVGAAGIARESLYGDVSLEADFVAGTLTGGIEMYTDEGKSAPWGSVNLGEAAIAGTRFAGTALESTNGHGLGSVEGGFFGPKAREAAGSFVLSGGVHAPSGDTSRVRGAFGARER